MVDTDETPWKPHDDFVLAQLAGAMLGDSRARSFLVAWPNTASYIEPSMNLRRLGKMTLRREQS